MKYFSLYAMMLMAPPDSIGESAINSQVTADLNAEAAKVAASGVAAITKVSAPVGSATAAAVNVIESGGNVTNAFQAFENALLPIVDGMISAFNPIVGDVASVVLPAAAVTIAKAVGGLYAHIGAALPTELQALLSKL